MKTFVRTTVVTCLTVLSVLVIGTYILHSIAPLKVQAAPNSPIQAQCIQPELVGIQKLLSKATNQEDIGLLMAKKRALEQAERDCIAQANANPPAQKPKDLVGILLPEPTSEVISPRMGIQSQELLPVGNFIPTSDLPNLWVGTRRGNLIEIAAGYLREEDENWQQKHPEWAAQGLQGALYIVTNGKGENGTVYPTPLRSGGIYLVSECGNILNVESANGTLFSFDVETLSYLESTISCPVP